MSEDKSGEAFDMWFRNDCPWYINEGDATDIWQAAQAAKIPEGWISVDEQIPPENLEVLVIHAEGKISIDEWSTWTESDTGYTDSGFSYDFVTHWMHLPAARVNDCTCFPDPKDADKRRCNECPR